MRPRWVFAAEGLPLLSANGFTSSLLPHPLLKYGFVFRLVTKGRNFLFNTATNAKRVHARIALTLAHSQKSSYCMG